MEIAPPLLPAVRVSSLIDELAAEHDNVHVVDFASEVARIEAEGLTVDGRTLGIGRFEGLVSLDGLHFSSTGYAVLANLCLRTMNEALGTDLPEADLAEVLATDRWSPTALAEAGLDAAACEAE